MNDLFNINPKVSTLICSIIGYILIDDLSSNEQNVLGNWLMLISQVLTTNAASQSLIESKINNSNLNINSKSNKNVYAPTLYNIDMAKKLLKNEDISKESLNKLLSKLDIIEKIFNCYK